ncbi:MAG: ABC transporter permease [Aggregatilineales bacterium]
MIRFVKAHCALLLSLAALLLLWHAAATALDVNFLPAPLAVLARFVEELAGGSLWAHTLASARRVSLSVLAGAALAAPLAVLAAQIRLLDRFITPLLYFTYPAPKVVFLPLIVVFLGLGDESKVFLIGLIIFFQVFVIVRDAAAQVRPETLESINALGANHWHRLRYVYLPVSLPAVMTALKVSAGTAIAVLFIAETIGTTTGLGYYIMNAWGRFAYPSLYAGILAMSLLGLALFVLFDLLEKRLTRWQKSGQPSAGS